MSTSEQAGELPAIDPRVARLPTRLYRSEMQRRWGPLYYLLGLWFFFRRLTMAEPAAERVRQAARKGPVVYVMRTQSEMDYLALNEVLRRRRLPLASFGTAVSTLLWQPLYLIARQLWEGPRHRIKHGRLPHPVSSGFLERVVRGGEHAAVFLRRASDWRDVFRPPDYPDPVAALLDAQERTGRQIQVLPVAVVWHRLPSRARSRNLQAILGTEEDPGAFVRLVGMAFALRSAVVQIGEPVSLSEYLERYADDAPDRRAKRLRRLLRRYCYRELRVVKGPKLKSPEWTRRLVLGSNRIRRLIAAEAEASGRPIAELQDEVVASYDKMAARFSYPWVLFASRVVRIFWDRIYSGIDVREEDLEAVRQAQREGVCVLVPCHKSHIDYMLLSSLLDRHDVVIPHIVAGENLSFFPVGAVFRRLGAFFIRRSFRGDRIFPEIFGAYLAHLFREGYTVEFFIEGGRSRTGKLLPPKVGVLGCTVDAGLEARAGRLLSEVTWLPLAISYEQVAEEGPYARELAGEKKRPESLSEVVKAGRVLLKRYGRVYVRAGEPVKLSEFLKSLPAPWPELDRDRRKEALSELGERLVSQIGAGAVVLPTGLVALALLAQGEPVIEATALEARVKRLRDALLQAGAEPSAALTSSRQALGDALGRFLREGRVERITEPTTRFRVVPERRVTLEYYKNGLLHFLAPAAMLASELRAAGAEVIDPEALQASFEFQLFLFRYEFILDPREDWEALAARGLEALRAYGALEGERVVDRERLSELAELVINFQESYYLTLRALKLLQARGLSQKELPGEVRKVGEQLLAVQDISRPEALSMVNLQNAARALRDEQLYQLRSGGEGLEIDSVAHRDYLQRLRRLILR
jgi:glycerol-3-phosphate O-acyltransferase